MPGSWSLVPGFLFLGPGFLFLGPRSWVLGAGCWILRPGAWVLCPGSWFVGAGSLGLGPESWAPAFSGKSDLNLKMVKLKVYDLPKSLSYHKLSSHRKIVNNFEQFHMKSFFVKPNIAKKSKLVSQFYKIKNLQYLTTNSANSFRCQWPRWCSVLRGMILWTGRGAERLLRPLAASREETGPSKSGLQQHREDQRMKTARKRLPQAGKKRFSKCLSFGEKCYEKNVMGNMLRGKIFWEKSYGKMFKDKCYRNNIM
jgi:hypothetical protein